MAPAAQPIVPFAPALGASLLVEGAAAIPAAADVGDAMRGDAPAVGLGQGQSVVPSAPALGALLLMEAATVDPSAAPADGPDTMVLFLRGGNLPFPRKLRESSGEFLFLLECN